MAWLGEGLSTLRGQITSVANFTKEVLSDVKEDAEGDGVSGLGLASAQCNIQELEESVLLKDIEISSLRRRVEELERASSGDGESFLLPGTSTSHYETTTKSTNNIVPDEERATLIGRVQHLEAENKLMRKTCKEYEEQLDAAPKPAAGITNSNAADEERATLIGRVQHLEAENKLMRKTCQEYEEQLEEQLGRTAADVELKQQLEAAQRQISELTRHREEASTLEKFLKQRLESFSSIVQELEEKNVSLQDENSALTISLEELDVQNQLVIDKLLSTKKALQDENTSLQLATSELQSKLAESLRAATVESRGAVLQDVATDTRESSEASEAESLARLLKLVPFELPSKSGPQDAAGLVTELVKVSTEDRWKRETLERKISEVMKQLRDEEALRKADVQSRDEEINSLRNWIDDKSEESLAVIPENSEEAEELERHVAELEKQLSEASRTNMQLKEDLHTLEEKLSITEEARLSGKKELQQALDSVLQLNQTISELNQDICNLETSHEDNMARQNLLKDALKTAENELQIKLTAERTVDDHRERHEADLRGWETRCQELTNNQNILRKELADVENTAVVANRKLEEAAKTREVYEEKCRNLETQLASISEDNSLQDKCRELSLQMADSNRKVAEGQAMIQELQEKYNIMLSLKKEADERCEQLEIIATNTADQNVLEHEVEKWRSRAQNTERELDNAMKVQSQLEDECKRLFDIETRVHKQEHLEREVARLADLAASTEQLLSDSMENKKILETKLNQLQASLEDQKSLKEETIEWREAKQETDQKLQEATLANAKLTGEVARLAVFEPEAVKSRGTIEMTQNKIRNLSTMNNELKEKLDSSQLQVQRLSHLEEEVPELKEKVRVTGIQLEEAVLRRLELEKELRKQEGNAEKTDKEKPHVDDLNRNKSLQELESLKLERLEMHKVLEEKTRENSSLHSENLRLVQLISEEKSARVKLNEEKQSEDSLMARETIANLSQIIREKDGEMMAMLAKCERMSSERDELVRTVQVKHAESVEYHREIQRLGALLSQEVGKSEQIRQQYEDKQKALTNAQNELISVKQRLDKLEQRDEMDSRQNLNAPVDEVSRLKDNLQKETTRNKYLQNEVQEAHEKESSLLKELGRLRHHLAQVEDSHTSETVGAESQLAELRARLAQAEDRAKSCSTALTSAQVRGNQQVEALQAQSSRAGQLRDEAQARLGAAEDQVQRHQAALTNLQAVLEQFQRDKERDISTATARLSARLVSADERNAALGSDIAALEAQLAEAKQGLSAAARLTEQMDKKSHTIQQLKEEVQRLNEQLQSAEGREKSASASSEGKVDRYLVKNLLIGYLVAPGHTKIQALRIIAQVLDFNQDERVRVGLVPGTETAGWFGSFMQPSTGPGNNQSLSEAFVRFLENESRPQPQLRLLPAIKDGNAATNEATTSAASGTRSPLLLADVTLPTLTQFQVARNSSSILKDVMKDS